MNHWHLFKLQEPQLWWLACIEADDAESAVSIYAHELRNAEVNDTTIPTGHDVFIYAVPSEEFHTVEAGWHFDPAQLHVNPVHVDVA